MTASAGTTASVVVVGGGVMGASTAYHLAARGWRDVVVLERAATPCAGSTGAATGGFRAQYATAVNVRLSLLARDKLRRFADEVGADPGYQPSGYLWLAGSEREMATLRAGQRVQHAEGLHEAVEVDADEVGRLNPAIARDEVVGGVFCPTDGFLRPRQIVAGYLAAAERLGVRIEYGAEVTGFGRGAGGRLHSVETSRGPIACGAVVDAAGPWAGTLAALAGIDLPVVPLRRQVASTVPCDRLPHTMPMTIFAGDGYHLRVRDGRVLLLWPSPGVPGHPWDTAVDDEWIAAVVGMTRRRVPCLADIAVDRAACWAGLYEMSPDKHALLGAAPGLDNFYLINGSSGHGVMHAPALGHLLAEIIADGAASSLDVRALRPARFAENEPNPVSELL